MTDIKLNAAGEIDLTGGKASLVKDADAVGQKLRLKISSFQGDWFLDLLFGLPYFGRIFRRGVNESDLLQIYQNAIQTTRGVASIDSLTLALPDARNRFLTVEADVTTSTGDQINISTDLSEIA